MPNCPKCDRPMATVMKREAGKVQTYYECPVCQAEEKKEKESDEKEEEGEPCDADPLTIIGGKVTEVNVRARRLRGQLVAESHHSQLVSSQVAHAR